MLIPNNADPLSVLKGFTKKYPNITQQEWNNALAKNTTGKTLVPYPVRQMKDLRDYCLKYQKPKIEEYFNELKVLNVFFWGWLVYLHM